MKKYILNTFALNLKYAQDLVKDVPDQNLCLQPGGVINHPAFVLGHLANTCDFLGSFMGLPPICPKEWDDLFGGKMKPMNDRAKYPGKEPILKLLENGHARVAKAFEVFSEAELAKSSGEYAKWGFPTVGDFVVFLLTTHEGTHLGQISAWRRAQGFAPLY